MIQLAHITHGLTFGGAESLVSEMLLTPPPGFNAHCICLDTEGPRAAQIKVHNNRIVCLNRKEGIDLSMVWKIAAYVYRHNIRVIHAHQYTPWFYSVIARLLCPHVKLIFTEHGVTQPVKSSFSRRLFNQLMSHFTHRIVLVSPFLGEIMRTNDLFPKKKMEVIFNGVEPAKFRKTPKTAELLAKLNLSSERLYCILPARFHPVKWHSGLVDAFAQVVKQVPNASLILLGDGPEKKTIEQKVTDLGLNDSVIMPGSVTNVAEWLSASHIFMLSSLSEGTSISLLEAMALELPAIVTNVGGNPYLVEDGKTGLLVPAQNAKELARAMISLLQNEQMRLAMGVASKKRYLEHFTFEKMLCTYQLLYER